MMMMVIACVMIMLVCMVMLLLRIMMMLLCMMMDTQRMIKMIALSHSPHCQLRSNPLAILLSATA